jgi:hypothetical protein
MKRTFFLAAYALALTVVISGCWRASKRDASNVAIAKIEEFKNAKGRLPDSLSEAGAPDGGESCPCYCKTDDGGYLVWYGTSLGKSETYDSESRKWSSNGPACARQVSPPE